jgi:WD40 repeat protein
VGAHTEPVALWDLRTITDGPRPMGRLSGAVRAVFSLDDQHVFITFRDPMIRVWRMEEAPHPRLMLAGHVKEAWTVAFSRDGTVLASGADDSLIKLWDVASGRQLAAVVAHEQTVSGLAFSPVRDELASVSLDGSLKVWSVAHDAAKPRASLTLARTLREPNQSQLRCVAYSADGALVAAAGLDPEILLWRLDDPRRPLKLAPAHDQMITALAFSPTKLDQLASASCDASFKFWNTKELAWRATRETNGGLMALAFSPSGDRLATSGQARLVSSLDTNNRGDLGDVIGHPEAIRSLAFSVDGQTIATACDDGQVRLCDTETNQVVISLDGHHARVNAVAFSPDGRMLASCSHSGEVFLWNGGDPALGPRPRSVDQPPTDAEPSALGEIDEIAKRP